MENFNSVKEKVRSANPISEVVSQYVKLTKNGQNYSALCPFHQEDTPSFYVNVEKQVFHCFGCGAAGDVFTFIEKFMDMDFYHALKFLAQKSNIPISSFPEQKSLFQEKQETDLNKAIQKEAVKFYHAQLFSDAGKEALDILHGRGFTDLLLKKHSIGFAPSGNLLKEHLVSYGFSINDIKQTGLLAHLPARLSACDPPAAARAGAQAGHAQAGRKSQSSVNAFTDFFQSRILFPNFNNGYVVHITGRALSDEQLPKYLHIAGEIKRLFNESALRHKEVVLTEGITDCLTLLQWNIPSASLYGTGSFKPKFTEKFSSCETVYLCMDKDSAGEKAALYIANLLGKKARIVTLPDLPTAPAGQAGGCKDVNAFFIQGHTREDFLDCLHAAQTLLEHKITMLPSDYPKAKLLHGLRPILKELAHEDELEAQNILTFTLKAHFKLTHEELKPFTKLLKRYRTQLQKEKQLELLLSRGKQILLTPKDLMTREEKEEALAFLKDPDMLKIFLRDIETLGCTGEEENKLMVGLALTSRKLSDPINLIVKGESSGGKNHLVKSVAQLFPDEDVEERTRLTSHALFYKEKDALKHKALILYERQGSEDSDYSIRSLQSEKKLIIEVPIKNPKTGKFQTEKYEVAGPVAYIETTTKTHLHPENETRCFDIFIDESMEQTRRIFSVQDRRFLLQEEFFHGQRDSIVKKHKNAQRLLEAHPVLIPYIKHIKFPLEPLRVRRDRGRFLTMIETSAFYHQYQREHKHVNGKTYILADIQDYALAHRLAAKVLTQTMKELTPKAETLISACESLPNTFTREDIAQKLKWNLKTVIKYAIEAASFGCLELVDGCHGKTYSYRLVKKASDVPNFLLTPEELEKRIREASKPKEQGEERETSTLCG